MLTSEQIIEIQADAEKAVKLQVTGYVFVGAHPEAERAGYKVGTIAERIFTNTFLELLPEIRFHLTNNEIV